MNLSKRAIFLIVPVLLLSFAAASITVYFVMENRVRNLEQTRLDLAATELGAAFSSYSTFADSYLLALTENNAFRDLVKAKDDINMNVALGASIESSIRNFDQHLSNKLSFLILQQKPVLKELYYFELSDDPFAEISTLQQQSYVNVLKRQEVSSWDFVEDKTHGAMIIVSRAIDQISFKRPIISNINESILVQFALEPTLYLNAKRKLVSEYNAKISIESSDTYDGTEMYTHISIGPDKFLRIVVPDAYLNSILRSTQLSLSIITLLFFIASSILLYHLVNRFITSPIHNLEVTLSEVVENNKSHIELGYTKNDEIGRLGKTFQKMYGALSESYSKTKELAEHDPLTKLYNLAYISDSAQKALINAKERNGKVGLIYIDLDNFKFVNDNYGHEIGDALLQAFASKLTRILEHPDWMDGKHSADITHGRVAGDEFSVIVSNYQSNHTPEHIAQRILGIFKNGFSFPEGTFPVSASIGIAIYPEDGHTLSQLVSNADNAMYHAKNSGKNSIAFYSKALATAMRRRMDIEQSLKNVDMNNEFHLVYMPLVCTKTSLIDGFEVLVRWESKRLGTVRPDEFIPIAEATGLFEKVDNWVTHAALCSYASLREKLGRDFKMSINLSSAQLTLNTISEHIIDLANRYGVAPKNIQLEMTETLNVEFTSKTKSSLDALCLAGFHIAIDDFGTGYTALLQLIEYPAQMIKFDKFFIDRAMSPENRSMLKPLISLCHSQGLKVTAEGVENKEIVDYLTSIGCDYLQGYFYGKPSRLENINI